jgi:NAD-dependent deacetylase
MLPAGAFERAVEAARRAEVLLSIGTSAVVHPAASIPMYAAKAYRAEVNIEPSAIAREMDEVVVGPAGQVLPRLLEAVSARRDRIS